MLKKRNFKTVVWKEGKYYGSQCLNVDVASFGKTRQEALDNLSEALELYFDDVKSYRGADVIHPAIVSLPMSHA